ncbi:MAG: ABC transporter permease [Acidobacteria bacterium]|nr:ABC transporter permease [Acidobacteriota bacterium]
MSFLLPIVSLWWRELVRFARQRSRVIGMVATPLLFWLFIGSGLGRSFRPPSEAASAISSSGYLEYFFPGTILGIVLFTSTVSSMSVIEDRQGGFLLSVLVAPIYRASLILGKVLGGATQAVLPALIVLLIGPLVGFPLHALQLLMLAGILLLISFSLACLGFFIAWRMDSVSGFHAILNLVLLPLWFLSGAMFPASGASGWIQWVMKLNPLTYGLTAIRHLLYWDTGSPLPEIAPLGVSVQLTALFAAAMFVVTLLWTGRPTTEVRS